MSETVREVIQQHHGFYEVMPYYVVLEERPCGGTPATRKIQAGFDVDIYGITSGRPPGSSPDYELVLETLRKLAETMSSDPRDSCVIEVIPFGSSVFLDARTHFQAEAKLRIRITHDRGLDQSSGPAEERALKEIQEQLHNLGVISGRGRT